MATKNKAARLICAAYQMKKLNASAADTAKVLMRAMETDDVEDVVEALENAEDIGTEDEALDASTFTVEQDEHSIFKDGQLKQLQKLVDSVTEEVRVSLDKNKDLVFTGPEDALSVAIDAVFEKGYFKKNKQNFKACDMTDELDADDDTDDLTDDEVIEQVDARVRQLKAARQRKARKFA